MAHGVPEVEDAAQATFALVLRHNVGLDAARFDNGRTEHSGITGEDGFRLAPDPLEQAAARDHSVLDDLVQARAELASWQRGEQRRINRDERRLVKGNDEVLAEREVDANFS